MATFRLQRLLELCCREERSFRWACQQAETRLGAAVELEQQVMAEMAASGCGPGNMQGETLRRFWLYRNALSKQLARVRSERAVAEAGLRQARQDYLAARQRRKMLEALKERHAAQERLERARKEQALLDEVGLRAHWQRAHDAPISTQIRR